MQWGNSLEFRTSFNRMLGRKNKSYVYPFGILSRLQLVPMVDFPVILRWHLDPANVFE